METLIIKPKDKAELKFFLELTKRMGVKSATIESDADERLFQVTVAKTGRFRNFLD